MNRHTKLAVLALTIALLASSCIFTIPDSVQPDPYWEHPIPAQEHR